VTTSLNIGTLAIGLSLIVGNYVGGENSRHYQGYPTSLFILAGTTYLFVLRNQRTLEKVTK
jgi:hypothetical protein